MFPFAFITNLAGPQGLIILMVVILLFGAKRLPELGKSLGETMRELTKARNKDEKDDTTLPPKA